MRNKQLLTAFCLTALMIMCFAGAGSALAGSSKASMTQTTDGYTIALKVLPAETFVSKANAGKSAKSGEMVNGGGASPVTKDSAKSPNHHLVVFIKKNGKPVEDADVKMSYEQKNGSGSKMKSVPVVHMWVAGKGRKTTHYGNNVNLKSGQYRVRVVVNHKATANFDVTVQ